ncbi:cobalamin-binding protein [Chitinivorax sp. B]|uniref:cobalamin-binding protein n=1 Tax=Chitinivorax sp. B TaxID=2502235 RepID=UPI0010F8E4DB|nr:cobalamin-binding protein [Chitinivorax sp. B]
MIRLGWVIWWLGMAGAVAAPVQVTDDAGLVVRLRAPAKRIVSLAPHVTELIFAAGAGDRLVAVSAYSDFPPEAAKLPQVADYNSLAIERIVALKPDLVVAWQSGSAPRQVAKLVELGIPIFWSQPSRLAGVADSIEAMGILADTQVAAKAAALTYRQKLTELSGLYRQRESIAVFYPIWDKPLTTINQMHLISDVIHLCGGRNVFGRLVSLTPLVSSESVLAADPEVILEAGRSHGEPSVWGRWPTMRAVRYRNLFSISSSLISRPSPRVLDGAVQVCHLLDQARQHRRIVRKQR